MTIRTVSHAVGLKQLGAGPELVHCHATMICDLNSDVSESGRDWKDGLQV